MVAEARERGSYVVDAVCPLVTKVHHEVKVRAGKGFRIVYVHAPAAWLSLMIYSTMAVSAAIGMIWRMKVAHAVAAERGAKGILICGSGIGMSVAANKVTGIRAALVWDATSARLCRQHNDANILCLGARLIGPEVALDCVRAFLTADFDTQGRHSKRLELIQQMEKK